MRAIANTSDGRMLLWPDDHGNLVWRVRDPRNVTRSCLWCREKTFGPRPTAMHFCDEDCRDAYWDHEKVLGRVRHG